VAAAERLDAATLELSGQHLYAIPVPMHQQSPTLRRQSDDRTKLEQARFDRVAGAERLRALAGIEEVIESGAAGMAGKKITAGRNDPPRRPRSNR
jgi:hypothetical protein